MNYASSIGGIFVFVCFAAAIVIMTITVARAVGGSKKSFSLPRISAPARVVSKRSCAVSEKTKMYFITFEYKTGDRAEYRVSSDAYLYFAEGDEGTITVRGAEFISFVV